MSDVLLAINLIEGQPLNRFIRLAGRVYECHLMAGRKDPQQDQLHFARHQAAVDLAQQEGHVRVKRRIKMGGYLDGVEYLQAVERVTTDGGQHRFDKAQAG